MQTRPLTKGTAHFSGQAISLDGKWIAFTNTLANRQIYKMPIEGGTPIQLTFLDADHSSPAWSVDGKRIAFISDEGGSSKIWIVDAGGGKPRQLAKTQPDPMGSFTIWSLGARILYGRGPGVFGANTILDPETEEEKPLVPGDSAGTSTYGMYYYSPDGKRVAGSSLKIGKEMSVVLRVCSLTDNSTNPLTKMGLVPFGWLPDGNWIYAVQSSLGTTSIVLLPSNGGNSKTIFTGKRLNPFGWSPDGS